MCLVLCQYQTVLITVDFVVKYKARECVFILYISAGKGLYQILLVWKSLSFTSFFFLFSFFFFLFIAAPEAYRGSWTRGQIGAAAAGLWP